MQVPGGSPLAASLHEPLADHTHCLIMFNVISIRQAMDTQ